jgi:hypothetical protein
VHPAELLSGGIPAGGLRTRHHGLASPRHYHPVIYHRVHPRHTRKARFGTPPGAVLALAVVAVLGGQNDSVPCSTAACARSPMAAANGGEARGSHRMDGRVRTATAADNCAEPSPATSTMSADRLRMAGRRDRCGPRVRRQGVCLPSIAADPGVRFLPTAGAELSRVPLAGRQGPRPVGRGIRPGRP